jgi:hypothetical protein
MSNKEHMSLEIFVLGMLVLFACIFGAGAVSDLYDKNAQLTNRIVQLEKSHSYGPEVTR